jgi:hypothetical protein
VQSNLDVRVVLSLIEEREARLSRTNPLVSEPTTHRRPVRRWIGRQLVRFGTRLTDERTMRPVRAP